MMRPLALEAKDPGDGVRFRYGVWSRGDSWLLGRDRTLSLSKFVSTVWMRAQSYGGDVRVKGCDQRWQWGRGGAGAGS